MNSIFLTDGYKLSHPPQYPDGTTLVYSNFTPRANKYAPKGCNEIVVFGTQMTMQKIHEHFEENFFKTEMRKILADHPKRIKELKDEVISQAKKELDMYLNTDYDMTYFSELWDLGYLPIHVKALPEGTLCPIRVPMLTIHNTLPKFFWVTNFLETIISNFLWKPITSATIALAYRKVLVKYAKETDETNLEFVNWQAHDFSMRGMDSVDATISSGLGHLTSFYGTDSLPTLYGARKYYNEEGFIAGSVPATEHSVMCAGSKEGELETFRRLLKIYPTGILSVVSDTWDLWNVINVILPQLKEEILAREGKLVIRPDSGNPVDIICGVPTLYDQTLPEYKGVIELLWDIFGGTINKQGYKVLDPHIGAIYGDSITVDRAEEICERLKAKGFASTNIVLGVGSFTYQYNTRDTFGFAMKATYVEKEELVPAPGYDPVITGYPIFKDPITDDGTKKSLKGLIRVGYDWDSAIDSVGTSRQPNLVAVDEQDWEEESRGLLQTIYLDGKRPNQTSLTEIRLLISEMFK